MFRETTQSHRQFRFVNFSTVQIKYAEFRFDLSNDLMMYRLAEIASYPGNPPTCTPIIAIEFPSNFLFGLPAVSSQAVPKNPSLASAPAVLSCRFQAQPAPAAPTGRAAASDCFKLELLNFWAGELLPARIGLPNAPSSSRFINV